MSGEAEALAQRFHEAYERLAPLFGYETRRNSAKPWAEVPENNRKLMEAVCAEILPTIQRTERQEVWEEVLRQFPALLRTKYTTQHARIVHFMAWCRAHAAKEVEK